MNDDLLVGGIDSYARADFLQGRLQTLVNRSGAYILISHINSVSGPVPAPNPPTAINPTIAAVTAGATTVTINCQTASGRLVAGDKFTIAGIPGTYTVATDTTASMDIFTNIPVTPALPTVAAGTVVTFQFINQQKVKAYIGGAFKTQIESGTITSVIKIIVPVLNLTFQPQVGDRVIYGGRTYLIGNITPQYAWGKPVAYELLVK